MAALIEGFTMGQATRLSGVPARTIDYWDTSGFLQPTIQQASGKGSTRLWSFDDLVALRVAGHLRGAGISLQALRKVIAHLRDRTPPASFRNTYLVSDGRDVFDKSGDELISTLRAPGQSVFAWIIDMGAVIEELKAAIAA